MWMSHHFHSTGMFSGLLYFNIPTIYISGQLNNKYSHSRTKQSTLKFDEDCLKVP